MRKFINRFLSLQICVSFCFLALSLGSLISQETAPAEGGDLSEKLNVDITEIHRPKFIKTPVQSGGTSVEDSDINYKYYDSSDEWMQIVFRYTLEDWSPDGAKISREEKKLNPIVPEVTFKIYVEGISKSSKKDFKSVLLLGQETYINVKKTDSSNKYRYGIFFIAPELVEVYGLKDLHNSSKGNIRVEAYIGDKKALKGKNTDESYKDLKEKDATWETDIKNMDQIQKVVITKDQTPWMDASREKFPMLKQMSAEKK